MTSEFYHHIQQLELMLLDHMKQNGHRDEDGAYLFMLRDWPESERAVMKALLTNLRQKGEIEHLHAFSYDDCTVCGSGYYLTAQGEARLAGWPELDDDTDD